MRSVGAAYQRHVNPQDEAHSERTTKLLHRPSEVILTAALGPSKGGEGSASGPIAPERAGGVPLPQSSIIARASLSHDQLNALPAIAAGGRESARQPIEKLAPTQLAYLHPSCIESAASPPPTLPLPVPSPLPNPQILRSPLAHPGSLKPAGSVNPSLYDSVGELTEEERKRWLHNAEEVDNYTVFVRPRNAPSRRHRHRTTALLLAIADIAMSIAGVALQGLPSVVVTAFFVFFVFASNGFFVFSLGTSNVYLHTVVIILLMFNLFWGLVEGIHQLLVARLAVVALEGLYTLRVRSLSSFVWFSP
jgi:hypothetical protein